MKRDFTKSNVVASLLADPPSAQSVEPETRKGGIVETRKTEKKAIKPAKQTTPPKVEKPEPAKKGVRKEFYLSPDLVEKIEGYALEEGEPEVNIARAALEEFFAQKKYEVSPAIRKMLAKRREKKGGSA